MKKILLCYALFALHTSFANAQTSHEVRVRSNHTNAKAAYMMSYPPYQDSANCQKYMVSSGWTIGGAPYVWHAVLQINIPTLPTGATIDSVFLSLWADSTSPAVTPGAPMSGDNAMGIYRITDAWDTATFSWNNQPTFVYTDADTLSMSTSTTENYLHINVTKLVRDMYSSTGNFGFLMKEIDETPYTSMVFYTPYEYVDDTAVTPLLEVYYSTSTAAVIDVNAVKPSVSLFPNPAVHSVNVAVDNQDNDAVITLVDCLGRTLQTQNVTASKGRVRATLDLHNYSSGTYMVRVSFGNGSIATQKLIIN
jgi:Secretion system C-terminal sorting domain